jgi:serine phosphatase RsbU (regulator of sigma subunit)
LKKNQIIILGTDGIWEARNLRGEMFGKKPIYRIIRQIPALNAKEILKRRQPHQQKEVKWVAKVMGSKS